MVEESLWKLFVRALSGDWGGSRKTGLRAPQTDQATLPPGPVEEWSVHEPSDECGGRHCHSHGVDEPLIGTPPYRVCFECNHVYNTADELFGAYISEMRRVTGIPNPPVVALDDIYFCPHCAHDFS